LITENDFFLWKENKVTKRLFEWLRLDQASIRTEILTEGNLLHHNDYEKKCAYAFGTINGINKVLEVTHLVDEKPKEETEENDEEKYQY
jgi:hypothetical protein